MAARGGVGKRGAQPAAAQTARKSKAMVAARGASLVAVFSALAVVGCSRRNPQATTLPTSSAEAPAAVLNAPTPAAQEPKDTSLAIGAPAPDVALSLQDGFELELAGLRGKLIVVYFCSSDAVPGCVREAHGFRDHWSELHRTDQIVVVGVSPQDSPTQQAFIAEHELPFDLATDSDGSIARAFKLSKQGEFGPAIFVVARNGTIRASWQTADPDAQTRQILAFADE